MGLVDGLLAREKHTFSSPLPIEACRQNIGWGVSSFGPGRLSPSPFLVTWWRPDYARLSLAGMYGRQMRRIIRVHLIPNPTGGTIAEATTELQPLQVAVGLVVFSVFAFIGTALAILGLRDGQSLGKALFPFGYVALLPLIGLLTMRRTSARQVGALVDNLAFTLAASSVDGIPSPHVAPRDPLPVPPPPMPAPIPVPVTAPLPPPFASPAPDATRAPRTLLDSLLARRQVTLFSPLPVQECRRRLDALSDGSRLGVAWSSDDEFSVTRPAYSRWAYRYLLRARLVAQPNGTVIEATTGVQPRVLRSFLVWWVAWWGFTLFGLAPFRGHLASLVPFLPVVLIWLAGAPVQYFAIRYSTGGQVTFLVTTLENVLGARLA